MKVSVAVKRNAAGTTKYGAQTDPTEPHSEESHSQFLDTGLNTAA